VVEISQSRYDENFPLISVKDLCKHALKAKVGTIEVLVPVPKARGSREPSEFFTLSGPEIEKQVDNLHAQGLLV